MSDTPTAHSTSSGLAEAQADLAGRLAGRPPAPAASPAGGGQPPAPPQPAPTPAPDPPLEPQYPAAPPAPAPPPPTTPEPPAVAPAVAPPTPAPAPSEPPVVPAEVQDPAARRYLEMHGGNLDKALAKALKDNNRLGELHRVTPEAFGPGGPADPSQLPGPEVQLFEEPDPLPPALEEVELDPAAIQTEVNNRVHADPNASGLIQAYMTNKARLEGNPQTGQVGLAQDIQGLESQIEYQTQKREDPDMAADDLRKGEIDSNLLRLQTQLGLAHQERSRIMMDNQNMDQQFRQYRAGVEQQVAAEFTEQAEEEVYTDYEAQVEDDEERRVLQEWPVALQRVITENQIPPEQIEDFSNDALRAYQAALNDDGTVVGDLYGFLTQVGKDSVARLDRYHRVRAGQYGAAAATRAAQPSPPTGPPGAPPPPEPQLPTPEEAIASANAHLKQRMRGGLG